MGFRAQILVSALAVAACAQPESAPSASANAPRIAPEPTQRSSYLLGSGDQLAIRVAEADEIPDRPFRIDEKGDFDLPMVGRVHAAGLSVGELQVKLVKDFAVFIKQPQVTVSVTETRSQPVSILGAVNAPGVHQLQGRKTLVEVLAVAGGLRADCGYRIKITRRAEWGTIPLPGATMDAAANYTVAEVAVKGLLEAVGPQDNNEIKPDDVITIPIAEMVYVIGDVKKSGGFVLGQRPSVSAMQALAMAEGLAPMAKPSDARILRQIPGESNRTEIPVDLKKIMAGKAGDVTLQQNDILFVPTNAFKKLGARSIDAMFGVGANLAVYRP